MTEEKNVQLYDAIQNKLLDRGFIVNHGFEYAKVSDFIRSDFFVDELNRLIVNHDYSCKGTLTLLEPLLNSNVMAKKPEDWISYLYQFTLNYSFPTAVTIELNSAWNNSCVVYLEILKIILSYQKQSEDGSFQSAYPFNFLDENEIEALEDVREYKMFKESFENEYIYEMMKLNFEVTGHATIDHICGVHYLALRIGRQVKQLGLPVDLGRISGAAAGHDIGKFGCKPDEMKKVAYFHYYYTDKWFSEKNINYIRYIAVNHSTWDLELENLSVESLILIYSDFCVKRIRDKNYPYSMKFYDMTEAFQVILDKLDNVDESKEKRYRKVYEKLKDFENYMLDIGVILDVEAEIPVHEKYEDQKLYALMYGGEIVKHFKFQAVEHTIELMHMLRNEDSLNTILDNARSEKDLNHFRRYVYVLEEYFTYLTPKQKLITLDFLYDSLIHPEEDLRKQCAELMGKIMATFDVPYRKELPEGAVLEDVEISEKELLKEYFERFLYPDIMYTEKKTLWIGFSLRFMLKALFARTKDEHKREIIKIVKNYLKSETKNSEADRFMLGVVKVMPLDVCGIAVLEQVFNFVYHHFKNSDLEIRLSAYDAMINILDKLPETISNRINIDDLLSNQFHNEFEYTECYAKMKILKVLTDDKTRVITYENTCKGMYNNLSDLYLTNLKTATPSVIKRFQIEMLIPNMPIAENEDVFYTAMHFCNLLKVSAYESVRNHAGRALVKMAEILTAEQINDITIELLRALEIEGYQFTKLIPEYLGQLFIHLNDVELDEIIEEFSIKIKKSRPYLRSLLLKTIGVVLVNYILKHRETSFEKNRISRLLGILFNGLVNEKDLTNQIALNVIGKDIFGSEVLTLEDKYNLFNIAGKKLLTLITETDKNKELDFLNYSAGLNYIYRFIAEYNHSIGLMEIDSSDKVAFYSGTFDPFSIGQRMVAEKVSNMDFDVYIALDEFNWNRRTQPNLFRRKIVDMSISNMLNVFTFPKSIPINLQKENSIANLKRAFSHKEVYIITGEDSLINNDAYNQPENSIFDMAHIIFNRKFEAERLNHKTELIMKQFRNELIFKKLETKFDDINSEQIRRNIDNGWDVSDLVDPLAQTFIYEKNIYKNEPQFKEVLTVKSFDVCKSGEINGGLINEIIETTTINEDKLQNILSNWTNSENGRILIIRDSENNGHIMGFSLYRCFKYADDFNTLEKEFSDYGKNQLGMDKIVLIEGVYAKESERMHSLEQVILTETLTDCMSLGAEYGIFSERLQLKSEMRMERALELHGFIKNRSSSGGGDIYVARINEPCSLILDLQSMMKTLFRKNDEVRKAIVTARERLQHSIKKLYPGNLILSFDRGVMYEHLLNIITSANEVDVVQNKSEEIGPYMCVPYGDIFKRWIIPNTLTKAFHTERCFEENLINYNILAYPNYLSIQNQTKTLKAFERPLILVDDLLDRGLRVDHLQNYFEKQDVEIKKIIVAIMSERGKKRMEDQGIEVDAAYYIPKLKVWFNESYLYPFMGGDSYWRGEHPDSNLLPTMNLILPYVYPKFIKGASKRSIYNFSKVCIENAIDILDTIERVYLKEFHRNLTIAHLGEVFIVPRYPEKGENMIYDINYKPTDFLRNDYEMLLRMENMLF